MIKNFSLILLLALPLTMMSCSSDPPNITASIRGSVKPESVTQVFRAGYEVTWRCTLKALEPYNLKISNKDAGSLITEPVKKYDDAYETPTAIRTKAPRNPITQYIEVRVTPIQKAEDGQSRTEVSVIKFLEKSESLFDTRPIKSNLIEEQVILYRVKRLLELERLKFERNRK